MAIPHQRVSRLFSQGRHNARRADAGCTNTQVRGQAGHSKRTGNDVEGPARQHFVIDRHITSNVPTAVDAGEPADRQWGASDKSKAGTMRHVAQGLLGQPPVEALPIGGVAAKGDAAQCPHGREAMSVTTLEGGEEHTVMLHTWIRAHYRHHDPLANRQCR